MKQGFSGSIKTKCLSLNNEPHMIRLTLTDLNPTELNYYQFLITADRYNGSGNVVDDLPTKVYGLSKKKKGVNVKIFYLITKLNEIKTLVKHISCDCN